MHKHISICILFIGISLSAMSQTVIAQRQKISKQQLPEIVSETFAEQYPKVLLKGWYATHLTYWQNDYSSDWYSSWYGQRTVVIYTYQKPNYYEVEFMVNPGELSRAIYNIYGYWYETRTQVKGLTMGIYDALKDSEYYGWKISPQMEKIESPMWPVDIYRFHVSKGLKSEIIRMGADGSLIQVKELSE